MDRIILHIDINNCYASIEQKLNPELKGKPIAVCGSQEDRRGIVLAKSEEAKACGVKTAEAVWQAKQKCKDLITVKPHSEEYSKHSKMAQNLYYEYTNLVQPFGIDECWIDVTDSINLFGSAENIANEILFRMREEVGLTVSIGVSFNKIFAKLGSDMKKPNAITYITKENFKDVVWGLKANELLSIGRKSNEKLRKFGINTIGDVANTEPMLLESFLGSQGYLMWKYANGLDDSKVVDAVSVYSNKSISNGFTCRTDLSSRLEVRQAFAVLAQRVSSRLIKDGVKCECVQVTIKYNDFKKEQFQTTLKVPINTSVGLLEVAMSLVDDRYDYTKPIRALTLGTSKLVGKDEVCQLDLFNVFAENEKREKVEKVMYDLNNKFGSKYSKKAITLGVQNR